MSVLNDPNKILNALSLALDYCNVYMPLFHRPTLVLPSYHPLLLLALCGLGAFLSGTPGAYESAKMIQKHVWQQSVQVGIYMNPSPILKSVDLNIWSRRHSLALESNSGFYKPCWIPVCLL